MLHIRPLVTLDIALLATPHIALIVTKHKRLSSTVLLALLFKLHITLYIGLLDSCAGSGLWQLAHCWRLQHSSCGCGRYHNPLQRLQWCLEPHQVHSASLHQAMPLSTGKHRKPLALDRKPLALDLAPPQSLVHAAVAC